MNGSPSSRQKATPVASTRSSPWERPRSSHSPIRLNGRTPSSSQPCRTAGRWSYRISSRCLRRGMLLSSIIAGAETNQARLPEPSNVSRYCLHPTSLPLQRRVRRAGPESEPVRRERHAVADVAKAVAVRRTELQLILVVLLEREAEVQGGPGRIQPLADDERDPGRVHRAPRELGEALLRLRRRAGGSQHRQDAPAVVPHRPVESHHHFL